MRPKKYIKARSILICVDDKDLSFLDDHRGKVTRGDYLIESMYNIKKEQSDRIKDITLKYQQISQENHELKKQLLFMKSKQKSSQNQEIDKDKLIQFYNEKLKENFNKNIVIDWKHLFEKNESYLVSQVHISNFNVLKDECTKIR